MEEMHSIAMNDAELLRQYVNNRSEEAFGADRSVREDGLFQLLASIEGSAPGGRRDAGGVCCFEPEGECDSAFESGGVAVDHRAIYLRKNQKDGVAAASPRNGGRHGECPRVGIRK